MSAFTGEGKRTSHVDAVIIGGGVIGCGVARDASLRGLRVALVEREDIASGTSGASTRLIHGGLRYLEQFDVALVRQDLAEREVLLKIAPHLVEPLAFLVPLYSRTWWEPLRLRAGMVLYDLLSFDRSLPGHRFLSVDEARALEPALGPDRLRGVALYSDAQLPLAERLCVENALDAAAHGAQVHTHTEVVGFLTDAAGRVRGVRAHDKLAGIDMDLHARMVINAAGPWLDDVIDLAQPGHDRLLRRTQGVHLVMPRITTHAVVLFAPDGRLFFVIPWLDYSLVGTTDTDVTDDPDAVVATRQDVVYLREAVETFLPVVGELPVLYTFTGVRALARREGVAAGQVSRRHRLVDHAATGRPGLLSIVGGKITAYRDIAEEVVDWLCRALEVRAVSRTRQVVLPGARGFGQQTRQAARAEAGALRLDAAQADHLVRLYGARYIEVLNHIRRAPRLAERLSPDGPETLADVHVAVAAEGARRLADVLLRRTTLGFRADHGCVAAERAGREMQLILGWSEQQLEAEHAAFRAEITRRYTAM